MAALGNDKRWGLEGGGGEQTFLDRMRAYAVDQMASSWA